MERCGAWPRCQGVGVTELYRTALRVDPATRTRVVPSE